MIPRHDCDGPPNGPVLLLGSSLGTSTAMWEPLLGALAQEHRVVRYEHRGHGGSPAPPGPYAIADLTRDVLELIDHLDIERAAVAGVSLGGMVAMWLGANAPERVSALALCCTSAHMPPASAWAQRAAAVREAGTTEPIADSVVDRWLTAGYAARHPEVRDGLRAMLTASDPEGYADCCGAIERMDLRAELPRIAAPTLVISGDEDAATPPEHQEAIAAAIPGARHEVLSPAVHIAPAEQPDAVSALILDHLDRFKESR